MGTPFHVSAPNARSWRTAAWLAGVVALVGACTSGGTNTVASHTPSPPASSPPSSPSVQPSSSPTAPPVTGAFGVLYSSQAASTYSVSIIGVDGKVVASASTSTPPNPTCANAAAALVNPPVSTSNSRAYFMDASGAVHWLGPDGSKDQAPIAMLPAPTTSRRSMFAVSPDDAEMAVVVDNFTSSGASTQLFMYDLNMGGTQKLLFSESGAFTLWPVGWHGTNNLVVGKIGACTQGGGPFVGTPSELHVVDPATADRRFTIGSSTCPPVNRPSPAGVVCENPPNATVLNWTAGTVRTYTIQGPVGAYLSPNGLHVAFVDNNGTAFDGQGSATPGVFVCGWIDDTHVLTGGDPQHQPRVVEFPSGVQAPVAAEGDCAGRLPGSL